MKQELIGLDEFREILRSNHEYRTPEEVLKKGKNSFLYKFDFWYYINLFRIVLESSKIAKQGKLDDDAWAGQSLKMLQLVERTGTAVNISGGENLEILEERTCVLVANHMSMMETFILPCIFLSYSFATYVLKQSLLEYPYFRNVLGSIDPIAVTRKNPREDLKVVLKEGVKKLKDGNSLVIFPQSTRSELLNRSKFNTLGHKLASRSGVPVIPVAIKTDFFGKGKIISELSRIDRSKEVFIKFGEPIENVKEDLKGAYERTFSFIADTYKSWGGEVVE